MPFDHIVTLQEKAVTRDAFGSEVVSWVDVGELWASVRQTGATEQYLNEAERVQAIRNAVMRVRYRGDLTEAAHRIVYDDHAWNILGVDEIGRFRFLDLTVRTEVGGVHFLPMSYNIMAGLSADAVPEASELNIGHANAEIDFPMFTDMHVLVWRDANEPDITSFVLDDDETHENQLPTAFTKYATQVTLNGVDGNVWVSNQLLTFAAPMSARVG